MAVDTAQKRFSIMDICHPVRDGVPRPTGTVNAAERQEFLGLYSGIAAGGGPPVVSGNSIIRLSLSISLGL